MISDEMIKNAACEANEAILNSISEDENYNHTFSRDFDRRIAAVGKSANSSRSRKILSIAAGIILVLAITGGMVLAISPEARAAVKLSWNRIVGDDGWPTYFCDDIADEDESVSYELTWVPNGYKLVSKDDKFCTIEYRDNDNILTFSYSNSSVDFVSSVKCESHEVEVCGVIGSIYTPVDNDFENSRKTLVFERNDALFILSADLSDDELINIAENIKIIEN